MRFRVPGTTTNLGHGFDCFGIALSSLDAKIEQMEHVRMLAGMLDGPTTAWSALVISVLTFVYMLSIRKHFLQGAGAKG